MNNYTRRYIRNLLQQNKFAYALVLLVGALCIMAYWAVDTLWTEVCLLYDIGATLVSASITVFFTLPLLKRENEVNQLIDEWGIKSLYSRKSDVSIDQPKRSYDAIGHGFSYILNNKEDWNLEQKIINKSFNMRLITIDPNSPCLSICKYKPNRIVSSEVKNLIDWVNNLKSHNPDCLIELRYLRSYPMVIYSRIDDRLLVKNQNTRSGLIVEYYSNKKGWKNYLEYFDQLWKSADQKTYHYISISRTRLFENCLTSYCHLMSRLIQTEYQVQCVVTQYNTREDKRVTIHKVNNIPSTHSGEKHSINQGVVGIANRLKIPVMYFFLSKNYYYMRAETLVRKHDDSGLGGERSNVEAIIAVPIIPRLSDEPIGSVTFDFRVVSEDTGRKHILLELANLCENQLKDWNIGLPEQSLFIISDRSGFR